MTQRKIALSIEEAADYTGIGRNTLRQLVEWKKLPVLKVGRKVLIKTDILEQLPLALTKEEDAFSKDLLLLMLKQYGLFLDSFQFACKNFKGNAGQTDIAKTIGFESNEEYNEIMFLREITHTINAFNEMADIVRLYSKKPKTAEQRLANLLSEVLYEDSESV